MLGTHRVSNKPEPGGDAAVEILFVPQSDPPVAFITNMYGNTLWTATWSPDRQDFDVALAFDSPATTWPCPSRSTAPMTAGRTT